MDLFFVVAVFYNYFSVCVCVCVWEGGGGGGGGKGEVCRNANAKPTQSRSLFEQPQKVSGGASPYCLSWMSQTQSHNKYSAVKSRALK